MFSLSPTAVPVVLPLGQEWGPLLLSFLTWPPLLLRIQEALPPGPFLPSPSWLIPPPPQSRSPQLAPGSRASLQVFYLGKRSRGEQTAKRATGKEEAVHACVLELAIAASNWGPSFWNMSVEFVPLVGERGSSPPLVCLAQGALTPHVRQSG